MSADRTFAPGSVAPTGGGPGVALLCLFLFLSFLSASQTSLKAASSEVTAKISATACTLTCVRHDPSDTESILLLHDRKGELVYLGKAAQLQKSGRTVFALPVSCAFPLQLRFEGKASLACTIPEPK